MRVWPNGSSRDYVIHISTHTPVRVWLASPRCSIISLKFQLTHPWGCDILHYKWFLKGRDFNSHTREGVTDLSRSLQALISFQLTHPWGCDNWTLLSYIIIKISTHTPVRVWPAASTWYINLKISTHTPVRVWPNVCADNGGEYNFNSHTREGVTARVTFLYHFCNFNSHTREGVTNGRRLSPSIGRFQLTHPWGCDTKVNIYHLSHSDFNSHTREGVTARFEVTLLPSVISTHTPVRVWPCEPSYLGVDVDFNSHTREGVTHLLV